MKLLLLLLFCGLFTLALTAQPQQSKEEKEFNETVKHVMRNLGNIQYCRINDIFNCVQRNLDNIFLYPGGGIVLLGMLVMLFLIIRLCCCC